MDAALEHTLLVLQVASSSSSGYAKYKPVARNACATIVTPYRKPNAPSLNVKVLAG